MIAPSSPPNDGQHSCADIPDFPSPSSAFSEAWGSCASYTALVRYFLVMLVCWALLLTAWFGNQWWTRRKLHVRLHTYLSLFWVLSFTDIGLKLITIYQDNIRTNSSGGSNQGIDVAGLLQVVVQSSQRAYFLYLVLAISRGVGITRPEMSKAERAFSFLVATVGFFADLRATKFSNNLAVGNFVWILLLVYLLRLLHLGFSQSHMVLWHMIRTMEFMRVATMDASVFSGASPLSRSSSPQTSHQRMPGVSVESHSRLPGASLESHSRLPGGSLESHSRLPGPTLDSHSRLPGVSQDGSQSRLPAAAASASAATTTTAIDSHPRLPGILSAMMVDTPSSRPVIAQSSSPPGSRRNSHLLSSPSRPETNMLFGSRATGSALSTSTSPRDSAPSSRLGSSLQVPRGGEGSLQGSRADTHLQMVVVPTARGGRSVGEPAPSPMVRRDPSLVAQPRTAGSAIAFAHTATATTNANANTSNTIPPTASPILSPKAPFLRKIGLLQRTKILLILYIVFQLIMQIVSAKLPILYQIFVIQGMEWVFSASLVFLFWLRVPAPFRLVPGPATATTTTTSSQPTARGSTSTRHHHHRSSHAAAPSGSSSSAAAATTTANHHHPHHNAMTRSRRRLERLARVVAHAAAADHPAAIVALPPSSSPFAQAPPISSIRLISQPPHHHQQLRVALAERGEVE